MNKSDKTSLPENPANNAKGLFDHSTGDDKLNISANLDILAQIPSIDGALWQLSLHPFSNFRDRNPDLSSLIKPAKEDLAEDRPPSNVFFNPAFLAASRDRMERRRIEQLIVWEIHDNVSKPIFSIPLVRQRASTLKAEHYRSLVHPFAPLGTPLQSIDRDPMLTARLSGLLSRAFEAGLPPILLSHIAAGGLIEKISKNLNNTDKVALAGKSIGKRAAILSKPEGVLVSDKKRRRELNRLQNRLADLGKVTFETATEPMDILVRFEEYLLMESRGWKGRKGSSIYAYKRHAAFARQTVYDLGKEGLCQIHSMRLDGKPLASLILFNMNGCYYPWKITFDESYGRYSPGIQLMKHVSEEFLQAPDFHMADSLADFGRSWVTSLWDDELELFDYAIAATRQEAESLLAAEDSWQRARSFIKALLRR